MLPSIRTTYLATSRSGRVVQSFDSPKLLREFIARQASKGVTLEAVEETTTRKALVERAISAPVKLRAVR